MLVRIHASSVNYRDLSTIEDPVSRKLPYPTIPNSDASGEIAALGAGVTGLAVGDRVMGCFFQDWEAGPISSTAMSSALGGARPGVLAEYVVLDARGVVPVPAAPDMGGSRNPAMCRADSLARPDTTPPDPPGETVLLLGTGGVSVFAQQFCQIMGARTIVTSSSDEKLERMRSMGAWQTINYRETAIGMQSRRVDGRSGR